MKSGDRSTAPTSDNPYHTNRGDLLFNPDEPGTLGTLKEGFAHEVDDLVKLELTAEEMVGDEVRLAREYVKEDTGHFWSDLKQEFFNWELATGQLLLTAADPTRVEWHEHHWWGDDEAQFH